MANLQVSHDHPKVAPPSIEEEKEEKETARAVNPNMELLTYALDPAQAEDFPRFFVESVTPWLEKRNIKAHSWIAGNFLFALVSDVQPWTGAAGIPNLAQFVVGKGIASRRLPDVG